ncbi:MAG TPA: uracil-DNA glycosylase family protein [Verrucomicrobiae bacterium]|nr:uracil-DNA glycosylase family protein [Verrucomicrobiae bacterium]
MAASPATVPACVRGVGAAPGASAGLGRLHARIRGCTRCADQGWLPGAAPVLPAAWPTRVVLVGQAPGRVEVGSGLPFSGRAGAQLFRWLARAGCRSEEEARRRIYCTSITKCYPGPAPHGAGDRRPTAAEVASCRPHLDRQLRLLRPRVVIAVGSLAQSRFLAPQPLAERVGRCFDADGVELEGTWLGMETAARRPQPAPPRPWVLPLPHPSGASRWLNQPTHSELLERALAVLARLLRAESGPA